MVNALTMPCLLRSSGTCPTPCSCICRGPAPVRSTPLISMVPLAGVRIPAMASTSSALPVALDPGDPEDLALVHDEVEA